LLSQFFGAMEQGLCRICLPPPLSKRVGAVKPQCGHLGLL
jgi:hypothetical protein